MVGQEATSTRVSIYLDPCAMLEPKPRLLVNVLVGGGAVLGRRRVRTTRIGGESRLFELYVYEVEGKKVTGWQSDSSSDNSMLSHLLYCALRLVIARTVERSTRTTTGRMDSCGREDALTTLGEPSRPTMSVWQLPSVRLYLFLRCGVLKISLH